MLTTIFLCPLLSLTLLPSASTGHTDQRPIHPLAHVYKFGWPIEKVAIIGVGVSGLIAYREFTEAGFQRVRLFERDDVPGGNWHYTDETPLDAPIPNAEPAVADYTPSLPPNLTNLPIEEHYRSDWEARWREHRGPRPVWESLESNSPAPEQQIAGFPWPRGTPWSNHA
ncbi:hypothetical protein B0H14DRAFT_1416733 [Mycena olivaceomarginata]|nr:hypothetical protein B0H14DRAFT_1416733 [Mycena olivaceomarginata]